MCVVPYPCVSTLIDHEDVLKEITLIKKRFKLIGFDFTFFFIFLTATSIGVDLYTSNNMNALYVYGPAIFVFLCVSLNYSVIYLLPALDYFKKLKLKEHEFLHLDSQK